MFRRILSPRQPSKPLEARSQSASAIQFNGGSSRCGEEGEEVKNSSYGNPDSFNAPIRSRSMIAGPTGEVMNPPLPPRNMRPSSFGSPNSESESALYVSPADTIRMRRQAASTGSCVDTAANTNSQAPGGGSGGGGGPSEQHVDVHPTRSEQKVMQMHQLTMNQRRGQGGVVVTSTPTTTSTSMTKTSSSNGHKRTRSFGHVTENSDYSVPFNLLQQGNTRPPSTRQTPQPRVSQPGGDRISGVSQPVGDRIIAINPPPTSPQPPSDRSDTNSPSSPMSLEQEPRVEESGDYAVPWDRSKIFQHMRLGPTPPSSSSSSHRPNQQRQQDRFSPPPPARSGFRYQSTREPMIGQHNSPPPPDLPYDPSRPHRNRAVSERVHIRDGSSSPVGGNFGGSRGEDVGSVRPPFLPQERPRVDTYPLPPPRDQSSNRDDTGRHVPSNSSTIDPAIPLEDQPWYHGQLTRSDAEEILKDYADFSFLVRKSESCQTDYSLSIRDTSPGGGGFYHLRLVYENDPPGYVLGQFSNHFERVTECIAFYAKQRLNIRGALHKRLGYPIPRGYPMDRNHLTTVGV